MLDGSVKPEDLDLHDLCLRMGWTLSELDEQDEARVRPALMMSNVRDALTRVKAYLESEGHYKPNDNDFLIAGEVKKVMDDGG